MHYFDNAATSYPKPREVMQSTQNAIIHLGGNYGRGGHRMAMQIAEQVYRVRQQAATFFGTAPESVIFTQNCTMSLNMAIKGLVQPGDEVLCSCLEHNAVLRPLHQLQKSGKIKYKVIDVGLTDEETVAAFSAAITDRTKMIVCTHASNVSGRVLPIHRIGELCEKHGIWFVVDAAQSAGILPINMEKDRIHALCMPGHKGLYGLSGTGLLLLRGVERIETLLEGGTGSLSASPEPPDFFPDRLEAGTPNIPGILSIGAGLSFLHKTGLERLYRHEMELCTLVWNELKKDSRFYLCEGKPEQGKRVPIVSFALRGQPSEETAKLLNQCNHAVRAGLHCAPLAHRFYGTDQHGLVRFAPSAFTTREEVLFFVKDVKNISKNITL